MGYIVWVTVVMGLICIGGFGLEAEAATMRESVDHNTYIEIVHPASAITDRHFSISVLLENDGSDKEQVLLLFERGGALIPLDNSAREIGFISRDGSYGETFDFVALNNASSGVHFLNLKYLQGFTNDNTGETKITKIANIAIPIEVRSEAKVNIITSTPESIFNNAEFPFNVEIESRDIDISDVRIELIAPKEVSIRGQTVHTFSIIEKGETVRMTSRIITPTQEVQYEHIIPFQITYTYSNDLDEQKSDTQTVSLLLRPRTFTELTSDGGIWIGGFFIAPYVSVGTIAGVPAGLILSLLARRRQKGRKR